MLKELYVKLPSGTWMKITGKLKRVVRVASRSKKGGRRQSISYTLIGESLDSKPAVQGRARNVFYITSGSVTKYILRLLDEEFDAKVFIEPHGIEVYKVRVYGGKDAAALLMKIAHEMNIVRHPRKTRAT